MSSKINVALPNKRKNSNSVDAISNQNEVKLMARRTRSSSIADNVYTQRSMRSAGSNAFFELPHNYGSRKSISESSEASPLRRSKRVSTSSSSSNYSVDSGISPAKKKKLNNDENLLKLSASEKENVQACNGHTIKEEDACESEHISSDDDRKCEIKKCEAKAGKEKNVLPQILENGDRSDVKISSENQKWKRHAEVTAVSNMYAEQTNSGKALQPCLNKSLLLQKCELGTLKRKRHFSEDVISSSGRIRRLSERGEMASVMEFFFKNKKPLSNSIVSSKKTKQITKKFLRKTDHEEKSNKLKVDCDVVVKLKRTLRDNAADSKLTRSLHSKKEDLKNKLPQGEFPSDNRSMKEANAPLLNGIQNNNHVIKELLDHINVAQDNKHNASKPKRSLRSSGFKCQPDYYALSLNLMIRRRRRNPDSKSSDIPDLQVMSDSEVDLNKKNSIESCFDQAPPVMEESSPVQTPRLETETDKPVNPPIRRGKGKVRPAVSSRPGKDRLSPEFFEPPPLFDDNPPVGPEVYFFESDHVALKHNTDYYSLLHSASVLESQRRQALADLDVLEQRLKAALNDPIAFVEKLQNKTDLDLPRDQVISSLPSINWSKYTSQFGTFENVFSRVSSSKPITRGKKSLLTMNSASQKPSAQASTSNHTSKSRSETFKKSWTVEEQRKLEELLVKYPQEAVESNRIRKIASELGGRTALQVQSRVQKYFIKLAKAGLPIPGRMPRLDRIASVKPRSFHRHRSHHQASLTRISTFFSDFHVPVKMTEEETGPPGEDEEGWGSIKSEQVSDEEDVPDELRFSDEYLEILQLKRQRKQQLQMFDGNGRQAIARHCGYQCDICQSVPIEGVRYHCIDCPDTDAVDLCQSCIRIKPKFETTIHKTNHRMEPIYASVDFESGKKSVSSPYADADYTKVALSSGEYNYLDPNFLPPSG